VAVTMTCILAVLAGPWAGSWHPPARRSLFNLQLDYSMINCKRQEVNQE